jgi:hypothetical protein
VESLAADRPLSHIASGVDKGYMAGCGTAGMGRLAQGTLGTGGLFPEGRFLPLESQLRHPHHPPPMTMTTLTAQAVRPCGTSGR